MKYLLPILFCVSAFAAPKPVKPKAVPKPSFPSVCKLKAKGNAGILKIQKQAKCPKN